MTPAVHHNHITRDIKPAGQCPACDRYWRQPLADAVPKATPEQVEELIATAAAAGKAMRPAVCPECRDGKHGNCIGYALDPATDVVGECECVHPEVVAS